MSWQMRGLLGAALLMVLSCGPSKDDAVRVKEGESLEGVLECPGLICAGEGVTEFCGEVLFEFGQSPPICLPYKYKKEGEADTDPPHNTCDLFQCVKDGKRCVLFDGVPVQVRCIDDDK